jgi:TRAP-type C4-dicarboxylate transport system permease small subunit
MRLVNKILTWITYLTWASLLFITLVTTIDVSGRFFFDRPLPGAVEMSQLLMPWIVFPALAFTLLRDEHVKVTLISDHFPKKIHMYLDALLYLIGAAFFAAVTVYGVMHFWESFRIDEYMMAPIYLPWWASKFALPFGTLFFAVAYFLRFILLFQKKDVKSALGGGY